MIANQNFRADSSLSSLKACHYRCGYESRSPRPSPATLKTVPIFEYKCANCGKKVTHLLGMTSEKDDEVCTFCGGRNLTKLVSKFRRGRSEDARVDEMADHLESIGEPESPAQMREIVKEMGRAMDDDMSDDMEEMFEADMEDPDDL